MIVLAQWYSKTGFKFTSSTNRKFARNHGLIQLKIYMDMDQISQIL